MLLCIGSHFIDDLSCCFALMSNPLKRFLQDFRIQRTALISNSQSPGKVCNRIDRAIPAIKEQFSLRTDRTIGMQSVPLYELDATAGLVALFDGTTRQVPVSHLQIPDLPPCDGALYVRGDSMYPLLKSGDIILYKEIPHATSSILWGEMYLLSFTLDGEDYITIKYIQKADDDRFVRLVSHNPHHSPKDIPADSIQALALVKASVRFNTMG